MQNLAQGFLTEAEQNSVTQAVKQAELQTSGEIVPMIVSASHDYPKARLTAALLYSLPVALLLSYLLASYLWLNPENVYLFLSVFVPLLLLFNVLVNVFPKLAKPFISKNEMAEEVEEEAVKSFFVEKLHATRDANGILVFISVFEKKAWILADYAIDQKIDPKTWVSLVEHLTERIANKEHCDGLCQTIDKIGEILKFHFPYKRDDTDELHNLIVR